MSSGPQQLYMFTEASHLSQRGPPALDSSWPAAAAESVGSAAAVEFQLPCPRGGALEQALERLTERVFQRPRQYCKFLFSHTGPQEITVLSSFGGQRMCCLRHRLQRCAKVRQQYPEAEIGPTVSRVGQNVLHNH
mmetsp:Transcript_102802/g.181136  ORF Transcript_102802/g.181136 Transcript_102802/m.181136 type:complete len:135 (-) Transcript_102802:97-501(-)